MLFVGWLASRLHWELGHTEIEGRTGHDGVLSGRARSRAGADVELRLREDPELQVPGLAGVALSSSSDVQLSLDRGPGGLRAHHRDPDGRERTGTLLGASRGEGGILGEGIRQALLRDPTYRPALDAARQMLPEAAETTETSGAAPA